MAPFCSTLSGPSAGVAPIAYFTDGETEMGVGTGKGPSGATQQVKKNRSFVSTTTMPSFVRGEKTIRQDLKNKQTNKRKLKGTNF